MSPLFDHYTPRPDPARHPLQQWHFFRVFSLVLLINSPIAFFRASTPSEGTILEVLGFWDLQALHALSAS